MSEIATLVSLKLSAWSGRKRDKTASAEITVSKHADNDAASVWKMLVSKEWLKEINQIDAKVRSEFYRLTLAYPATSIGVLPETARARFDGCMANLFDRRKDAVKVATLQYDVERDKARHRLGDMFSEGDYPTARAIAGKYDAAISYLPMPAGWKAGIDDAALERQMEQARKEGFQEAYRDAWKRIADCVGKVSKTLQAYRPAEGDNKAKGTFRDSLIENARQMVDTLDSMVSVFDDPGLRNALDEIKQGIAVHSPDVLRGDDRKRAEVQGIAKNILDKALRALDGDAPGDRTESEKSPGQPKVDPLAPFVVREGAPWSGTPKVDPLPPTPHAEQIKVEPGDDWADLLD